MYNLKKKELYKILMMFHEFHSETRILVSKKRKKCNQNTKNNNKENNCINVYKIREEIL